MIYFQSNKFNVIFGRWYYLANMIVVYLMLMCTFKTIPVLGPYVAISSAVIFTGLSWKFLLGRNLSVAEYRRNYISLIYIIMIILVTALAVIKKEYILIIPFMMSMIFGNVNVIFKSNTLKHINILFMCTPMIKILVEYRTFEYFAVFTFITSLTLIINILFTTNKKNLEAEGEVKANFVKEVFKLTSQLTNHDVRNSLTKMMILSKKEYRENLPKFLDTYDSCVQDVMRNINLDVFTLVNINITSIVNMMSSVTDKVKFIAEYEDEVNVKANYNIVYSTIKNLIENSIEAANRNNIAAEISLIKYENVVEIIDNCGGFDVSKIALGVTTKKEDNHGIFLRTIVDPAVQNMFGFSIQLYNTGNGTRIVIQFAETECKGT